MKAFKRTMIGVAVAAALSLGVAQAQVSDGVIKIGVLSDMSSLYTDLAGARPVLAAQRAATGSGGASVRPGGDGRCFPPAGSAFGVALERDTEAVVLKNGGKVLGKVRQPLNTQDFSSFLLQAQASKAKIVGLANAGGDTTNSIKQAAEFGIVKGGQNLAGLLVFLTDIHSLGLQTAQGLVVTNTFYWDSNDQTRAWAKRFAALNGGKYPTMV